MKMEKESKLKKGNPSIYWQLAVGVVVFAVLFVISRNNYLLFHGIAEIFSSLVAFTIFVLAWHTRSYTENDYLLFLGIAYLFVGMLDLVHMLAYSGMGVFGGYGTNLATQLWISARYIEAASLLLAPFFLARRLRVWTDVAVYSAVSFFVIISIFYLDIFPTCFVEGTGLTPFKRISEYVISLILIAAIVALFRKRDEFDPRVFWLMVSSISITVASELCFTLYQDPYAFFNLMGHFLKIISFYLIYLAIIETGLEEPYELLFKELSEKGKRKKAILDATADSLVLQDLDGKILVINDVAARIMGKEEDELVGASISELKPPFLPQNMQDIVQEILVERASVYGEYECEGKWYENTYYPVLDEGGGVGLVAIYSRDITERKRMEEQLRESEEKYRLIVDSAHEGIWAVDRYAVTTFVNSRMAEMLGYEEEEMLGRILFDFMDEKGKELAETNLERREAGISEQHDFEFIKKDGRRIYSRLETSPLYDAEGEYMGALAMVADITERRRMEEELRESEEKFRSIVEQSSDGITLVDQGGVIMEWNSAQEDVTGLRREEAVGKPIWDIQYMLTTPEQKTAAAYELLRENVVGSLEKSYTSWFGESSETEILTPGGERRIMQTVTFPIRSSEGMMMGSITRDITRRVRMEETLAFELEANSAVAELSAALLAQASIEDVSYVMLEKAKQLTESPFGFVGYIESETGYLISPTLSRDMWDECGIADRSVVFKEFNGLWGWVLDSKKPLLTNEPHGDPRSTGVPHGHIPIERFVSVPALLGGALVGQIALANSIRDYYERDIALLNRLADLYAIAVLRMWSEEELDKYREHLEELVRERTLELERINLQLQEEVTERKKNQEELRASAEQLRALSARVESVREEERRRVAREVHDTLGQALTGLKINLSLLGRKLEGEAELEERIASMSGLVDTTIKSVREIATELRPGVLDDLGLAAALDWQVKRFGELTGLEAGFISDADDNLLNKDLTIALFRIAQEALTNVARHAEASRVEVRLAQEADGILLEIKDNGKGVSEEETGGMGGLGVLGMRERAHIFGGEVGIEGDSGTGTTVAVRIPLDAGDRWDDGEGTEEIR
ncbi:MAG: PAS domain S-box protein [Actinobacteria bacterium]|nr:PAS domain S-box protein [Actinomycetota bacterium]